jgi:alkylation response protein AidB-like acyl-CoA dehydrogenase
MDLSLSDEQRQLVESFTQLLSKESSPEAVRAAEPVGFDASLWASLAAVGVGAMAVDTDHGGWGASFVDLVLVAELLGRHLAPAPVVEVQVAARLLARCGSAAADELTASITEGGAVVTLALHPARAGALPLVPAGAVAQHVVALDGDRLVAFVVPAGSARHVPNLGDLPLADLEVPAEAIVVATGPDAVAAHERAVDEWLVLTAAALVGSASAALDLACTYAVERRAFGVPIGTFQGVAHPLADSVTAVDGAQLLVRKAAWAADVEDPRRAELAAMAFAFASEAARDATYHALHVHGGYGFMLEQDVQLHHRRARAWARVWGEPASAYRRAARHRYDAGAPDRERRPRTPAEGTD